MSHRIKQSDFFENNIKLFSRLGISNIEYKIYKYLLDNGGRTILEISKAMKVPRTTVYQNIDKLRLKGLISDVNINNVKKIVAENPESLQNILQNKITKLENDHDDLEKLKVALPKVLKKLIEENITNESNKLKDTIIKHLVGENAVYNLYLEIFQSGNLLSYANDDWLKNKMPYINETFRKNIEQGILSAREIIIDLPEINYQSRLLTKHNNYQLKIINYNEDLYGIDYSIYSNKIAIIYFKDEPEAVVIEDEIIFNHAKATFDLLWDNLPTLN